MNMMKRLLNILFAGLLSAVAATSQAGTNRVTNEPDSVYLFSYSHRDEVVYYGLPGVPMKANGLVWQTVFPMSIRISVRGEGQRKCSSRI